MEIKDYKNLSIEENRKITQELIEIDQICFGDVEEEDEGSLDYWLNIDRLIVGCVTEDNDKIIGYIDFLKISSEGYEKIISGERRDGQLNDCVLVDQDSKEFYLYLVAVCILPNYRKKGLAMQMWNYSIKSLLKDGYKIKGIIATIWSEDGKKFLSQFDPVVVGHDPDDRDIYLIKNIS